MSKIIFFLLIILSACTQKNEFEVAESDTAIIDQLPDDFAVPQVIWDSMKPTGLDEKEKPIVYAAVKLFLKEKNKGVLRKSSLAYEFPRGGGELDLSTELGAKPGTFLMGVTLPDFENVFQKKVFFISESRQRKVEDEVLGSGCNKVLDITSEFFKKNQDKGIEINTTRNRHDSILGGHMIFIAETERNWLLTQITFFNSARPDLFCKNFRVAAAGVK